MSKDRNLVLVVDDDSGMLRGVQRLLRQHVYEPVVFSSAQAFKSHTDFENAVCVILDINLNDGSGIELRHGLKAAGVSVPIIYITRNESPAVREAALWVHRVSNKAFLRAVAAQESIGRAFMRAAMLEEHLTVDQCDELAKALREDAACLPHGPKREKLLQLAQGYRLLADMKRTVLRKVN